MLDQLLALADPGPGHAVAVLAAFVAGLTRGFSGFGNGMIYVPAAAAALSPVFAVASMQVMVTAPVLLFLRRALPLVDWRTLGPIMLAAFATVPIGIYLIRTVDPVPVRWTLGAAIGALLVLLWSGWRMRRQARRRELVGIGGIAGMLGGIGGVAGPPVVLFYMAGRSNAAEVRASLHVYLAAISGYILAGYLVAGLMTANIALWGAVLMLPYTGGMWLGARLFSRSNEALFRRVAFVIIAVTVILSLPLFDGVFR